jgi:hypothetical protein
MTFATSTVRVDVGLGDGPVVQAAPAAASFEAARHVGVEESAESDATSGPASRFAVFPASE